MKQVNGPWKVHMETKNKYCPDTGKLKYVDSNCWIRDVDDKTICVLLNDKVESSASLIAAAPEMLQQLQNWKVFMLNNYEPEDISWFHKTLEVIDKAKGESDAL